MYERGVRRSELICQVDVGKWYEAKIEVYQEYNRAEFVIKDFVGMIGKCIVGFKVPDFKWGYFLDFFMGGDKPARQDTVAWIERLK
jgi:hypothetical protein